MLGWAAEGAILVWIGHRLASAALRSVGLVLQAIVAVWMLALYSLSPRWERFVPVFNETFLSFVHGLAALAVTLAIYARSPKRFGEAAAVCRVHWQSP